MKWTNYEINLLKINYNLPMDELLKLFPGRSEISINTKRKRLNLQLDHYWTPEELEILSEKHHINKLIELLPNRTKTAILNKRRKLKLHSQTLWTDEELSLLIEKSNLSTEELSELLPNRSWSSIKSKKKRSNLSSHTSKPWTEEEMNIIRDNIEEIKKLPHLLSNRTKIAIFRKRLKLFFEDIEK